MQRPVTLRHLDVASQVWRFLGQLQEIHAIQTQSLDRRPASNSGGAGTGFGESRFAEAVTWFHRRKGDSLAVLIDFHDSRPTGYEDIKRIRRIPLPNENVTEFVAFLLQEGRSFSNVRRAEIGKATNAGAGLRRSLSLR